MVKRFKFRHERNIFTKTDKKSDKFTSQIFIRFSQHFNLDNWMYDLRKKLNNEKLKIINVKPTKILL